MFCGLVMLVVALPLLMNVGFAEDLDWEQVDLEAKIGSRVWISPHDGLLIAQSSTLGIVRSIDQGEHFESVELNGPHNVFEFHPANPDIVWCGYDLGMKISYDGGANWDVWSVYNSDMPDAPHDLLRLPGEEGPLLMVGGGRYSSNSPRIRPIYAFVDSLNDWDLWCGHYYSHRFYNLFIRPENADTIYATRALSEDERTIRTLWRTWDEGDTWEEMAAADYDPTPHPLLREIQFDLNDNSILYANCGSSSQSLALVSTDGGAHFEELAGPWSDSTFVSTQVQLLDDRLVVCGSYGSYLDVTGGVWQSFDGGQTWEDALVNPQAFPGYYDALDKMDLRIDPNHPERMYLFSGYTLFSRTVDSGGIWTTGADGLGRLYIDNVYTHPEEPGLVLASVSGGGVLRSHNYGENWALLADGFDITMRMHPLNPNYMVLLHSFGNAYVIPGEGSPFQMFTYDYIADFQWHPTDLQCGYRRIDTSALERSDDGLQTWTELTDYCRYFAVDNDNPDYVYVINDERELLVSTDRGDTFTLLNDDIEFNWFVDIQDGGPDMLIMTYSGETCVSLNEGVSFSVVDYPYELRDMCFGYDGAWLGRTGWTVRVSFDQGEHWPSIASGLMQTGQESWWGQSGDGVSYTIYDDHLYRSYDPLAVDDGTPTVFIPQDRMLIYPNPANAQTVVSVTLDRASDVTLTVTDVLGRQVETLPQGRLTAGVYRVPLTLDHYPSGTYMVHVNTESGWSQTKRLVVVK
ncbi:T9SS type A sorting domain-containing protein [bacterium]|nr:T9SS type A sorting domain-containing protein [bacterium]